LASFIDCDLHDIIVDNYNLCLNPDKEEHTRTICLAKNEKRKKEEVASSSAQVQSITKESLNFPLITKIQI